MKIETATVVWGETYIKNFFNYSLKSILINQNIPYIQNGDLIINIIFRNKDREIVEKYLKEKNSQNINAVFFPDENFIGNKYTCHSKIVNKFIQEINSEKYVLFYYPDMILSKNFVKNLMNYEKFELIFFPAPRVIEKNFKMKFNKDQIIEGIDEFTLNEFIINNLNIKMKLMTSNSDYFNGAIGWLIFKSSRGLIIKSIHQTPVIVKKKLLENLNIDFNKGLDDYLSSIKITDNFKMLDNSKNLSWCSLENDIPELYLKSKIQYEPIINWINLHTNKFQRKNFLMNNSYFVKNHSDYISLKKKSNDFSFIKIIYLVKFYKIFTFFFRLKKFFKN